MRVRLRLTALAVAVAIVVGTIELLQVSIAVLGLHGSFMDVIARFDFGVLGYLIVGMFLLGWDCRLRGGWRAAVDR